MLIKENLRIREDLKKEEEFNFRCCFIRFKKKTVSCIACSDSQELHGPQNSSC